VTLIYPPAAKADRVRTRQFRLTGDQQSKPTTIADLVQKDTRLGIHCCRCGHCARFKLTNIGIPHPTPVRGQPFPPFRRVGRCDPFAATASILRCVFDHHRVSPDVTMDVIIVTIGLS